VAVLRVSLDIPVHCVMCVMPQLQNEFLTLGSQWRTITVWSAKQRKRATQFIGVRVRTNPSSLLVYGVLLEITSANPAISIRGV